MASVTIRMDDALKKQAEILFDEMGMNMTTAFTIFTKAAVRQGKIPFEIAVDIPNAETIAAIEEVRQMRKNPGAYKSYANVDEMFKELLADEV